MNKIIYKILAIAVFVSAIGLYGCKKFLDRPPKVATIDDLKGGELEGKVLGLYGEIRNSKADPYCGDGFQSIAYVAMNGFRSDDAEVVADPGASQWHQTFDNFQYVKDDWGSGIYWNKHYVFIGLCNDALEVAANVKNDPATPSLEAEAKFFRAYSYFDLVRTFGEVPKIDFKINKPTDAHVAKSPADVIWDFIESDLISASEHLPLNWGTAYPGRLTSGAAKTLLAKVYIYRKKWSAALPLLQDVIASNEYKLHAKYWEIFKTQGELNEESIFEIQASKKAGDGDIYWSRLGQCQGIRGSGDFDLGWGWNTPTDALVQSYENGDLRKAATILFSGQSDGGTETGGYGFTIPNLTNAKYWNKKVYNKREDYLAAGLGTPNNEAQNTWVNQRVLRYAEVLLLAAEAANEIGGTQNITNAQGWVNAIRDRAGLTDYTYTTQTDMRAQIKKQRRAEFAMEYERFFDLVRWGDAQTVLGSLGYQDKNKYYPIPQAAINENPKLEQNPNY